MTLLVPSFSYTRTPSFGSREISPRVTTNTPPPTLHNVAAANDHDHREALAPRRGKPSTARTSCKLENNVTQVLGTIALLRSIKEDPLPNRAEGEGEHLLSQTQSASCNPQIAGATRAVL